MIIGNREAFIGIKIDSIISSTAFFYFSEEENYILDTKNDFSSVFIQTGQDP